MIQHGLPVQVSDSSPSSLVTWLATLEFSLALSLAMRGPLVPTLAGLASSRATAEVSSRWPSGYVAQTPCPKSLRLCRYQPCGGGWSA